MAQPPGANRNYQCRDCGRQFVENPQRKIIAPQTIELVEQLLLERIPLTGIARALKLSNSWLQSFVNRFYEHIPKKAKVSEKAPSILILQLDELWSFVSCKAHKKWIWLSLDNDSREIVGCYIGDRFRDAAKALWKSLPGVSICNAIYRLLGCLQCCSSLKVPFPRR